MGKTLLKSQNSFPVTTNVLHIFLITKTNDAQLTILNKIASIKRQFYN